MSIRILGTLYSETRLVNSTDFSAEVGRVRAITPSKKLPLSLSPGPQNAFRPRLTSIPNSTCQASERSDPQSERVFVGAALRLWFS
jgi:hypothetical protein